MRIVIFFNDKILEEKFIKKVSYNKFDSYRIVSTKVSCSYYMLHNMIDNKQFEKKFITSELKDVDDYIALSFYLASHFGDRIINMKITEKNIKVYVE